MKEKERIFVFGASGHAKVVIDVIERQELYEIAFLVDDDPSLTGMTFFGYPVIGGKEELLLADGVRAGIVAIGSNRARSTVASWLVSQGYRLVSAVHPMAQVARGVAIGPGSVLMAGSVVNSGSSIGANVIVNTCASIDHDCMVADGVHVAPGCTLCGTVNVGEGTFICSGTVIIPNLNVGRNAVVGAGSTVIRNVPDGVTVVGSPARELKQRETEHA